MAEHDESVGGVIRVFADRLEFRPSHGVNVSLPLEQLVKQGDVGGMLLYGLFMQQARTNALLERLTAAITAAQQASVDPVETAKSAMKAATDFLTEMNASGALPHMPKG